MTLCAILSLSADAQTIRRRPPTYYNVVAVATPLTVDTTNSAMSASGRSYELPLTITSNTNRVLVAATGVGDATALTDSIVWVVTSPSTRQKLTKFASSTSVPSADRITAAFGLIAPNSGAGKVTWYFKLDTEHQVGAVSFYNANQSSQFADTATLNNHIGATATISITSATGEIVLDFLTTNASYTWTKDASQTLLFSRGESDKLQSSYKAHSVTSMVWTTTGAYAANGIAVRIKPL